MSTIQAAENAATLERIVFAVIGVGMGPGVFTVRYSAPAEFLPPQR